jgi:hypothetical protein
MGLFSSFKSYGSRVAIPQILSVVPPITRKKTVLIAGGNGANNIVYSDDNGITFKLPNNQIFSSSSYGRCGFDGNRLVVASSNSNIAYSNDFGLTWISTGFNLIGTPVRIIYIKEKNKWFAVGIGSNGQNIATSNDGINWTLLSNTILDVRVYHIVYNGSVYIAVGFSNTYPMATSIDGITWEYNTTYKVDNGTLQFGFDIIYDGNRYIFVGGGGKVAISVDCITWNSSNNVSMPFDIRKIAYNNVNIYVAGGTKNGFINTDNFIYWSNDAITWYAGNNNNILMGEMFYIEWDGTHFIACGTPLSGSTTNIIYSTDGKNWTASNYDHSNNMVGIVYGITSITY